MTNQRSHVFFDRFLYTCVVLLFLFLPVSRAGMNVFVGLTTIALVVKVALVRDVSFTNKSDLIPMLALLGSALLSMIGSANLLASISEFLTLWLKYSVVYLAVMESVTTEKRQQQLSWVLFTGGLVSSAYAVYQHWIAPYSRVTSFMNNPNPAGTYLAIATLLSMSLLISTRKMFLRMLCMLGTVLGTAGVFFTMSRGALLGLLAAFLAFTIVVARLGNAKKAMIWLIVGLTLIAILTPDTIVRRFQSAVDLQDNSNRQRMYLFLSAWKMFGESFLNGKGVGTFGVLYPQYKPDGASDFEHPHNFYIHIMAEMGIFGVAAVIWCIFVVAKRSILNLSTSRRDLYWANSLAVLLIGVLLAVHGLVDVTIRYSEIGLTVVALVALIMKGGCDSKSNEEQGVTEYPLAVGRECGS